MKDKLQKIRKQLSTFENEVLTLYLDGNNYQQIGEKMNKSSKSIDNALQRLLLNQILS